MSDIVSAIAYVLRQEDSHMTGNVTDDPRDSGGRTRYGVAETSHPELTSTGYFDGMTAGAALVVAEKVYTDSYCVPLSLALIRDQQVANAVLSFAINEGVAASVKVIQQALRGVTPSIVVDGKFGPASLAAINSAGPLALLNLLGVFQRQHYTAIVAANPKDAAFLDGWINRVTQNCSA